MREKLTDALIPGYQAEFDPDEAEKVGAFHEDALSEQDALDSDVDLVVVAACKHPHFRPELFANIRPLRPELNANEPELFANSLQTSLKTHINCKQENTTYSSESSR